MMNVTIAGRAYPLAVEKGQETKVTALASHVDAILSDLKRADPLMDRDRQLILAALQLASEVADYQEQLDTQNTSVMRFHRDLATRLEQLIPH
jgi:cell division protein ZapA (FtsZ GTPase activity inhibitor)